MHFAFAEKIHLGYIVGLWAFNIAVLKYLNCRNRCCKPWSNSLVLVSNYALLVTLILSSILMDSFFPVSQSYLRLVLVTTKANASSFTLALLDFYFSSVDKISFRTVVGALTWNATACTSMWLLATVFGGCEQMSIVNLQDLKSPKRLLLEYGRFVMLLLFSGLLTDLVFSPIHRLMHASRRLYARHHARHHEYRARLTSLVLFHGEELDDLLMAACPIVGFAGTMAAWSAARALLPAAWWIDGAHISSLTWRAPPPPPFRTPSVPNPPSVLNLHDRRPGLGACAARACRSRTPEHASGRGRRGSPSPPAG